MWTHQLFYWNVLKSFTGDGPISICTDREHWELNTNSLSVFTLFSPRSSMGMLRWGPRQNSSQDWGSLTLCMSGTLTVRNPDLKVLYRWLFSLYLRNHLSCIPPWALQSQSPTDMKPENNVWEPHCYSCPYQNNSMILNAWIAFLKG